MEGGGGTTMDLVNESGLEVGWMVSKIHPPAFAVTVVVKGTFKLHHEGTAVALPQDEQKAVTGDEFNEAEAKLLQYPSDFAPFKPRADFLVVGHAYSPGGRPVGGFPVSFRAGSRTKSLVVIGDRYWQGRGAMSEPSAVTRVPLGWNMAFGGTGHEQNPLGKGHRPITRDDGSTVHPLPNIELPGQLISDRRDHPEPAGFGPLPDDWPQRRSKFGKINSRYFKERWPGFPENMDWGFFNAASEDQQWDGYFKGDEELHFENLHPTIPRYRSRLPGLRVRVFLNELVRAHDELREVPMLLDTVWAAPDAEQVVLVWRGHATVRTESLSEVYHLLVHGEPLAAPVNSLSHFNLVLQDALDRRAIDEEDLEPETEPEDEEAEDIEAAAETEPADAETALETKEVIEPSATAAPAAPEDEGEEEISDEPELLAVEAETDLPDVDDRLTIEQVREKLAAGQDLAYCDLSGLMLAEMDFSGVNLKEANLEKAILVRANIEKADLSGAILAGADLRQVRGARVKLREADLTESLLSEANLEDADLGAADFTKARLRGANLFGAQAAEAIFEEADLTEVKFTGADLSSADLCKARVHRTDFGQANLTDAAMEQSWGHQVVARGANLTRLRAAGARLCAGNFESVQAEDSVWQAAQLHAANFTKARLGAAEFSNSYLGEAIFDAAEMKFACLNEANLVRARLHRTNLFNASLEKAELTGTDFTESNLYGATLMDVQGERTTWTGANLRRIKARESTT
jgi:uncharacterized protein YjbI with pentapeptide repeats